MGSLCPITSTLPPPRTELGMAAISIPELHRKLKEAVEPGTVVPSKVR